MFLYEVMYLNNCSCVTLLLLTPIPVVVLYSIGIIVFLGEMSVLGLRFCETHFPTKLQLICGFCFIFNDTFLFVLTDVTYTLKISVAQ